MPRRWGTDPPPKKEHKAFDTWSKLTKRRDRERKKQEKQTKNDREKRGR